YIRWNIRPLRKVRLWWRGEGGVSRTEGLTSNGAGVGDSRMLLGEGMMGDKMGESQSGEVMAATEVAEQVGGLELQDVVAWGCGLCQGHLPAAAAAAVVAVAGTIAGRAGTVVVVVVVAAAVAFVVAVVASDLVGPLRGKAILRWRDLRVLALVLGRILTLRGLLFVVVPWLLRLLRVGVALEINNLTFSSSDMGQRTLEANELHRSA
ncbi:hypothetical protein Taro_054612, partial [Colocasia esculenta]|nr:hypothetical protein [Colocasia esculenta]